MYCPWAKFISRGFTECCWPSRYILSCERFMCLKLYGFFLKEPLKASLSTHPMTILVGNCPVNKLSWVASILPPGMVKVLHTSHTRLFEWETLHCLLRELLHVRETRMDLALPFAHTTYIPKFELLMLPLRQRT